MEEYVNEKEEHAGVFSLCNLRFKILPKTIYENI